MCGVWCAVYGVWCVVCGVWCVACGVWRMVVVALVRWCWWLSPQARHQGAARERAKLATQRAVPILTLAIALAPFDLVGIAQIRRQPLAERQRRRRRQRGGKRAFGPAVWCGTAGRGGGAGLPRCGVEVSGGRGTVGRHAGCCVECGPHAPTEAHTVDGDNPHALSGKLRHHVHPSVWVGWDSGTVTSGYGRHGQHGVWVACPLCIERACLPCLLDARTTTRYSQRSRACRPSPARSTPA